MLTSSVQFVLILDLGTCWARSGPLHSHEDLFFRNYWNSELKYMLRIDDPDHDLTV